jgi:hypothetical protein
MLEELIWIVKDWSSLKVCSLRIMCMELMRMIVDEISGSEVLTQESEVASILESLRKCLLAEEFFQFDH